MIKAIAIDDEPIALKIIEDHASKIPFLQIEASFTNAFHAIEYLKKHSVDLLLLDINMHDISGLDFLKTLTQKPLVIFTTAYSEYALESYEHDAVDYLLKPFEFGRFLKAINKASERLNESPQTYIFLKSGYEYVRLELQDILFVKAEGNYMKFVCKDQTVLSRLTLQETEEILKHSELIKVHRSYLANFQLADKIEKHQIHFGEHLVPITAEGFDKIQQVL
ncbi:LytR/AlgR family response regulator transcription factor [Roseivirga pacifica]|uniref:LytR/AlgR family response regulator transcription factor n=1 Tax=Roseivirga pacifica TaxID=1267423 RepID=UPI00227B3F8D|nr:response regulator transcription factor [Roseivirga pacifica]